MATRKKNGSGDQHHQRTAEILNGPAHAHLVAAASRDNQDHRTDHELTREALEHSARVHELTSQSHSGDRRHHAIAHEDIATLAYRLWESRGCPVGSPENDWLQAMQQLQVHGEGRPN